MEDVLNRRRVCHVVGEVPNVSNSRWNSFIESETRTNYKKYIDTYSQKVVLVFPTLMCFVDQMTNEAEQYHLDQVITINRTLIQSDLTQQYLALQGTQKGRQPLNVKFISLNCIPPNKKKRQSLHEFFQYQKTTKFEPSEKIFHSIDEASERNFADKKDDSISGKEYKDFANLHFKFEGKLSVTCHNYYDMSQQKFETQYNQFGVPLDQLKMLRLDLCKLCTNKSMCMESRHKDLKEVGLGLQLMYLVRSISHAINSYQWNPKWAKSYYWIEKTCKAVCDIIKPYCVDESKGGMIMANLIEFERKHFSPYRNKNLLEHFDAIFLQDQPKAKQLIKNMVDIYEQFSDSRTVEQRNVFKEEFFRKKFETAKKSDAMLSSLRDAKLSLYVIMRFPITNGDCYKHVLATFNEIIKQANERKQLFKNFTEDQVLSDLVLYDIGIQLLKLRRQ